jgi:hypothetical protein
MPDLDEPKVRLPKRRNSKRSVGAHSILVGSPDVAPKILVTRSSRIGEGRMDSQLFSNVCSGLMVSGQLRQLGSLQ